VFANRYTALVDACALAGALRRNLLLTLAEAEFFRVRWSQPIMDETRIAIEGILSKKHVSDATVRAVRACGGMMKAFEDAMVAGFEEYLPACAGLPDPKDAHVLAAALKTRADVIVTENLNHFPDEVLDPLGIEAHPADTFIANTIALEVGRAVTAIRRMRERLVDPTLSADDLFLKMEAQGLIDTVDTLKPYIHSL